jgi:hypothetical protein
MGKDRFAEVVAGGQTTSLLAHCLKTPIAAILGGEL